MTGGLTRRALVGAIAAAGGLVFAGCKAVKRNDAAGDEPRNAMRPDGTGAVPKQASEMKVYRDPNCGCCEAWAKIARQAGYQVQLVDHEDMTAIKRLYGVPAELASCHTAIVGTFAFEGHVPLEDVARLLRERPSGIRGIAVPGMPRGSPGMEMPDGIKDRFEVVAFDDAGKISVFGG